MIDYELNGIMMVRHILYDQPDVDCSEYDMKGVDMIILLDLE